MFLQVAQRVKCTEAEGPGKRYALWLQGCPLRCPGCCNPEFLAVQGGTTMSVAKITAEIDAAPVQGISLLGGEPTMQAEAAGELAMRVQALGKSVMLYSGFTLDELRNDHANQALLAHTDLLIDGPYLRDEPETQRRWIGSRNQKIHFLSDRYSPEDPCWTLNNTLEIRMIGGEVTVNGFPAREAKSLWQGWRR